VSGAIDAAGCEVLSVGNHAAIAHGEAAIVARTHGAYFVTDTSLLPFEPRSLVAVQLPASEALIYASLLVELALADGVILLCRRRSLGKRDGGRCNDCRHKDKFHDSHGVSPSVAALI
jgi:hypothetical protein